MIKSGTKCKVKQSTPLTPAGTPVIVDKNSEGNTILGKTGMVSCRMPQSGCLFFAESNLKPVK